MKYKAHKPKALFVIKNVNTGQYLHKCKGTLIGKGSLFSKAAYDWEDSIPGKDRKLGAELFTREDSAKILKHLREQGFECARKAVGKR